MVDLQNVFRSKQLSPGDVFDEYDRDRSHLLGIQELVFFSKAQSIPLDDAEAQVLDAGLRKLFGRSDIKKAELTKIINYEYERKYDLGKAERTFRKFFPSVEDDSVIKGLHKQNPNPLSLRLFKRTMNEAFGCSQSISETEMDNFTQYMDQKGEGYVDMGNFMLVQRRQYQPVITKLEIKKTVIEAETDLTDILLPLKTELAARGIHPPDLFDAYDTDKNYLLSLDELVDIMATYTGYRLTAREHDLLAQAVKRVSGTTGMRTQLKRAEMVQLLELVEVRKGNDPGAARAAVAALQKLDQAGKFVIPETKQIDEKARFAVCEFKHLLKRSGIQSQTDIDLICDHFDQKQQGFVEVAKLKLGGLNNLGK